MPEIKIRNVNGKLVGIDENGNQVALEFEDTVHDSVNTGDARFDGNPWYDIREFGAVGDGSTDDGPAIQAAIDAANSDGGGRLWYPAGSFRVDTPVKSKADVWHIGKGWGQSVIQAGNLGDNAVFQNSDSGADKNNNIVYRDLEFDGTSGWQNVSGYEPARKFIFHQTHRDLVVNHCKLVDSAATAIGCDFGVRDWYLFNYVKDAGTGGQTQGSNGIGIGVGGPGTKDDGTSSYQNMTWVIGNEIRNTAMHAITFENVGNSAYTDWKVAAFNTVLGCHTGVSFEDVRDGKSFGNIIRNTSQQGILLDIFPNSTGESGPDRVSSVNDTVINGSAPANDDIVVGSNASRCRVVNPSYLNGFTNDGTRCVVAEEGVNSGDPSAGNGQWAGESALAYRVQAEIRDTTTTGDIYRPLPPSAANNWIRVSGTGV